MVAKISQHSKRELVQRLQPKYPKAERQAETNMLDAIVAVTGLHCKAAIRRLCQQNRSSKVRHGKAQRTQTE